MPDIADLAQNHMEREEPYLIASRKKITHAPDGHCLNCAEPVATGLYCDAECREDFERRQQRGLA